MNKKRACRETFTPNTPAKFFSHADGEKILTTLRHARKFFYGDANADHANPFMIVSDPLPSFPAYPLSQNTER